MSKLFISNETDRLISVILGTAASSGKAPRIDEAYDPKSIEHLKAGTYPKVVDMVNEMEAFNRVLQKHNVQVFRPNAIEDCNQIFTRDIGFVIDDLFFISNILPNREKEIDAIQYIIDKIDPKYVIRLPEDVHVEGGDVMIHNEYIFIGTYKGDDYPNIITARTNMEAVKYLKNKFPNKIVKEFDLNKSATEPRDNALHLDCCFQPVSTNKAIIYKGGFKEESEYQFLVNLFGKENIFEITRDEMYHMNSNVFSIAPNIVVSEQNFTRLNTWLREQGITVEEIPYAEISKQEGLLRCSTLPLIRRADFKI
ncbi:MAG TPA: amidinotransferase [Lutibacter sp.]|nr:amidinotransferase [Lutibacter sp.]